MNNPIESTDANYDCIIAGGGLAGLSLAILLGRKGRKVLLLEKGQYPFHKVCGEYISNESYDFLVQLGLPVDQWLLPSIRRLQLTTVNKATLTEQLDLGGFGISRFCMDAALAEIARKCNVDLREEVKVISYAHMADHVCVQTNSGQFTGRVLCASFGKHAPGNFSKPARSGENWVGVKYHIRYPFPDDLIALHTFNGGYCGISRIEDDRCCLCYLVKASQLKTFSGSISLLEQNVLSANANLAAIFRDADFLFKEPVTVSNVKFAVRKPVHDKVFYLGDSAGSIAPLSGNGMSMALRASYLLSRDLQAFFEGRQSLETSARNYRKTWLKHFRKRILVGRTIQFFFCQPGLTGWLIGIVSFFPFLRRMIIRNTHGQPF